MTSELLPHLTCPVCSLAGHVSRITKSETEVIRGRSYEVNKIIRRCNSCSEEFENSQDEDWRAVAYARYRADTGMVAPETMVNFRKIHNLSQEQASNLLGWNTETLRRYECGCLQTEEQDIALDALMSSGGLNAVSD